jgi:hypothetical protein
MPDVTTRYRPCLVDRWSMLGQHIVDPWRAPSRSLGRTSSMFRRPLRPRRGWPVRTGHGRRDASKPNGQIVQDCWDQIPVRFPHATGDAFVVISNHVHGVVIPTERIRGWGPACRAPTRNHDATGESHLPTLPVLGYNGHRRPAEMRSDPVNTRVFLPMRALRPAWFQLAARVTTRGCPP